jgi:hypothetical protein
MERSRPGNVGIIFGFTTAVLLAVIAWGLWSRSGGAPTATVAVAVPNETAASPAPQTYAANTAAEPADYTIACSIGSSGSARGVVACDSMKWGQRCQREAEFRSAPTAEETRLVIANRGNENLKFYWLDMSGRRTLYAVLPPGRKIEQPSHIGAHWLIAGNDGRCVGIFNADTARIGIF